MPRTCKKCRNARERAKHEPCLDYFIDTKEAKPLMVCANGKVYSINYPGGYKCHIMDKIDGGHVLADKDDNIEFLNCADLFRSLTIAKAPINHARYIEVRYIEVPNFGYILMPWHGREIVYFQDLKLIKPARDGWHAVLELEGGGVVSCFENERGYLFVLNDLGELIRHYTMEADIDDMYPAQGYRRYKDCIINRNTDIIYRRGYHTITLQMSQYKLPNGAVYEFTGPRKLIKPAHNFLEKS